MFRCLLVVLLVCLALLHNHCYSLPFLPSSLPPRAPLVFPSRPKPHFPSLSNQPRSQGFSLKKWVGPPHPFFEGKALGTRLLSNACLAGYLSLGCLWLYARGDWPADSNITHKSCWYSFHVTWYDQRSLSLWRCVSSVDSCRKIDVENHAFFTTFFYISEKFSETDPPGKIQWLSLFNLWRVLA